MAVKSRGAILSMVPDAPPAPPPNRGRLMAPDQVAAEKFGGHVTAQWVRRNVRPKVRLGHSTVLFYELDVDAWLEERRKEGVA
jgi:hypothetical protein